jgi:hypothetical protein
LQDDTDVEESLFQSYDLQLKQAVKVLVAELEDVMSCFDAANVHAFL